MNAVIGLGSLESCANATALMGAFSAKRKHPRGFRAVAVGRRAESAPTVATFHSHFFHLKMTYGSAAAITIRMMASG
jgi:hypothetical protein